MQSYILGVIVFAVVFAGGMLGLQLQRALPENYTTGAPRDMIGAVSGLLTLLLALVLGLLIWTAFGVYSSQKLSIQSLALSGMRYDEALRDYGPDAAEGRRLLRAGLKRAIDEIWNSADEADFVVANYTHVLNGLRAREGYLKTLQPTSDAQIAAKAAAGQAAISIAQTRSQLAVSLVDPINYPLLGVVVTWAGALFCAYGLMSKRHPMTYAALALGALAISSAIYVIADLSSPYSGLIKVSPAPIAQVLEAVDASSRPAGGVSKGGAVGFCRRRRTGAGPHIAKATGAVFVMNVKGASLPERARQRSRRSAASPRRPFALDARAPSPERRGNRTSPGSVSRPIRNSRAMYLPLTRMDGLFPCRPWRTGVENRVLGNVGGPSFTRASPVSAGGSPRAVEKRPDKMLVN